MPRGNGGIIGPVNTSFSGVWSLTEAQLRRSANTWPNFYAALLSESATGSDVFSGADNPDPYFEYTTLLLPGNGTNGAQNNTFLDGSTNNFTITRNGNTTQGTFSPFSQTGWGNYFNGSSRFSVSSNVALTPGSGDFTIECWIYPTAAFSTFNGIFVGDTTGAMNFGKISGGIGLRSSGVADIISATAPSINQWTHIAITRSGTDVRLFYDGVQQGSTVTNSTNFAQSTVYLGDNGAGTAYWNGYLSNLRFVKGTALYTSNFTPSTTPLTAISNTQFLTFQSNRFIDNSTNAFTLTPSGSPSVVAFSPFNPTASWSAATYGGSGYFDGNGDYLSAGSNSAFAFGTGAYTVECWVYPSSVSQQVYVVNDTTNGSVFYFETNSSAGFSITPRAGTPLVTGGYSSLITNSWNHVVFVRGSTSANQTSIFVNGTRVANGTDSTNWTVTGPCLIGGLAAGGYMFTGYLSSTRVVKGTAVYDPTQTTLTVPTAPLTAITNTSLLLNFTNAGIYDATSKNDLETVGNAQISTTQSKWGGSSMYFDGTADYLLPNGSATNMFTFGTGDFTVEFWMNAISFTTPTIIIFDCRPLSTDGLYPCIYFSSGQIRYFVNNADRITGSTLSASQWYHIALSRSGTNTKLFVDGTQVGSTYTDSNNYLCGANRPSIGCRGFTLGDNNYYGYLQDLRITKGYARYTANFTAPTAAFPTL
jgi:hypothetical protein